MESRDNVKNDVKNDVKKNIIIGYIFEFLKQNKLWVFITLIIVFITNPFELIVLANLFSTFSASISKNDYKDSMNTLLKIAGVYTIIEIINIISSYFDRKYYPILEKFVRIKLIDVIFKNIEVNYDNENISDIILKILQIPTILTQNIQNIVYWVISFIITFISVIVYILHINFRIGFIIMVIFIIFLICYYFMLLRIKKYSYDRSSEERVFMTHVDDILSNSLTVLSCRKVKDEKEYLNNKHLNYDKKFEKYLWYSSAGSYLFSIFASIAMVLIMYVIIRNRQLNKISNDTTMKLIVIILFFTRFVKTVISRIIVIATFHGKLEEMEKNITKIVNDTPNNGIKENIPITGDIVFKNVSFEYNKKNENNEKTTEKVVALHNVSFKIKPLDRVAIVGTNGSGKSTIIKLIMGYYNVSRGEVLHNGTNVLDINREYLRSKITIINQNIVLFNRSIIDNICYGNNIPKEKVIQILKKLHVMRIFKNQPNGLETLAGLHGSNLSGGQKQIIHLLRSYLSNKPIIIMDEPTSAIDSTNKKYILRMINEMSKKSTLIIVTHDEEYAASFPTKIYIEDGKITKINGDNNNIMMSYDQYDNFLH